MFGRQDDSSNQPNDVSVPQPVVDGLLADTANDVTPANDAAAAPDPFQPTDPPFSSPPSPVQDITPPASTPSLPDLSTVSPPPASGPVKTDDLLDIKQKALGQLSPLVGHLEQSPEEKFRTTMMMIQASDDQSLVTTAYEAAQSIPDEKTRAQALLDVINEINYFTQHHES